MRDLRAWNTGRLRDADGSGPRFERLGYCLIETRRFTIAPPGCVPLRPTTFSLVDVPDLRLLVQLWPDVSSVWMGAGPTPAIWHRLLRWLAWLVRLRVLPSLSWLASTMHWATNVLRRGEHRGGMFVHVEGVDVAGAPVTRSWHLLAEGDSGPFIPSMACEAIIRHGLGLMKPRARGFAVGSAPGLSSAASSSLAEGLWFASDSPADASSWPAPGARPALRELEVPDYAPLLARRSIAFGVRDDNPLSSASPPLPDDDPLSSAALPLYRRIAGEAWHSLPRAIREMHSPSRGGLSSALPAAQRLRASSFPFSVTAAGRADVTRGRSLLARIVASIIGLPREGRDIPVTVRFDVAPASNGGGPCETWTRTFAERSFSSEQFAGTGRFTRLLCERFGPITLALAVVIENSRLHLIVRGWTLLGIPLPRSLAPSCNAHESEHNGFFHFDVAISHPWTGLIVHYRGWLVSRLGGLQTR